MSKMPLGATERKRNDKVDAKQSPFTVKPKICPLLSIATLQSRNYEYDFQQCIEGECAFYLSKLPEKMEKCVFVRLALSVGMMAERRSQSLLQKSLQRRMASAKRQHRPIG